MFHSHTTCISINFFVELSSNLPIAAQKLIVLINVMIE